MASGYTSKALVYNRYLVIILSSYHPGEIQQRNMYCGTPNNQKYLKERGIVVSFTLTPLVHLSHVECQSFGIAIQFSALVTVHSSSEMVDRVLLHCLLAVAFEVALATTPLILVPHSRLNLLKINIENMYKEVSYNFLTLYHPITLSSH